MGFVCKCDLCETDRNDPLLKQRQELIQQEELKINELLSSGVHLNRVKNFLKKVRLFSKKRDKYHYDLLIPLYLYSKANISMENYEKAEENFFECYKISKEFNDNFTALMSAFQMATWNKAVSRSKEKLKMYRELAKDVYFYDNTYFDYLTKDIFE